MIKSSSQEQTWNKIAPSWAGFRKRPIIEVENFLKTKSGRILDLGCGSGRNITKKNKTEFYGVDFSAEMLRIAKKETKDIVKAQFFRKDIGKDRLPFEDDFFDAAIFISTLHCIIGEKNREYALMELYRVMKPGSEAMVSVWDKEGNERVRDKNSKEGMISWKKDETIYERYYYFYDKEELEGILKRVGFKIERVRVQKEEVSKHSRKNFIFYVQK